MTKQPLALRAEKRAFAALLALPKSVRRALAGPPRRVDGQRLNPDIQVGMRILALLAGSALESEERNVPEARRKLDAESWVFGGKPDAVGSVRDLTIPGPDGAIPARLYLPESPAREAHPGPLPLLVYFHGGGRVLGSIESHDLVCRALCARAQVAVLNVDYRLAPEHPFPAGVDDAVAAFRWAHANAASLGVDPDRIAVGGDSAGGNLSAVVCQVTHAEGGPAPAYQLLFVPATNLTAKTRSFHLFNEGYFLTETNIDWYKASYAPEALWSDPRVSPLLAEDVSGLAPAYVAVAGFDPLRDEGIAYAERLRAAGVPVTLRVHEDAVHPFINILATELGQRCMTEAVGALRAGLNV